MRPLDGGSKWRSTWLAFIFWKYNNDTTIIDCFTILLYDNYMRLVLKILLMIVWNFPWRSVLKIKWNIPTLRYPKIKSIFFPVSSLPLKNVSNNKTHTHTHLEMCQRQLVLTSYSACFPVFLVLLRSEVKTMWLVLAKKM